LSARRLLVPVAGALALALAPLASPAAAHVTVQGPGAQQGGFTKLTFRTPTEKDVPTTKIEIAFPVEHPIASVRVKPKPGWTYEMVKAEPSVPVESRGEPVTEVVTRIIWTTTGQGIGPTEFDEFEVSAGRLPNVDRLVFKALQTYADGEVVRWIEEPVEGGEELEHPAPVLELVPAEGEGEGAHGQTTEAETAQVAATEDLADADDVATSTMLGGAGLAAGLVALALGLVALWRTRRPGRSS
jgi:uncharacterized protein YcnI